MFVTYDLWPVTCDLWPVTWPVTCDLYFSPAEITNTFRKQKSHLSRT